jgi:hypothetical protein
MIMEKPKNKFIVPPDNLEEWLIENPDLIYNRSLETSENILNSPKISEDLLLEFQWESATYAKIYMKRKDIESALKKSIDYFVRVELYEKAQKGKNILDRFTENS